MVKKSRRNKKKESSDILPKFGFLTNPSVDIIKEIKWSGKLGVDYIEIGFEPPLGANDILLSKRKQIRSLLKRKGLFCLAHSPYWTLHGSMFESIRKAWVETTKSQINVAHKLRASKFVIHSSSKGMVLKTNKSRKQVLDNYVKSMRSLVSHGKPKGVMVVLENMPPGGISDVDDLAYIISRVPGLGFHLDVGHAFIDGRNKGVKQFIRKLGSRLEHVHIHDNHGHEDEHLQIGKGLIDYEMVVKELKRLKYDKTITLEVFESEKAFKVSLKKIKKMWGHDGKQKAS